MKPSDLQGEELHLHLPGIPGYAGEVILVIFTIFRGTYPMDPDIGAHGMRFFGFGPKPKSSATPEV